MMKRRLRVQESRREPAFEEIEDGVEDHYGRWGMWGDEDHTPADCSSCYAWCASCVWNWVHDGQPRRPCEGIFEGWTWGRPAKQPCDGQPEWPESHFHDAETWFRNPMMEVTP